MNYIYIYSGDLPEYALTSINSVLSVDNEANVILCTETKYNFENVNCLTFSQVESELTKKVKEINYFENNKNSLWETSLLRIFYLLDVSNFLKLNNFIHFDVDVMVYKPFKDLVEYFKPSKFNITTVDEIDLIFSYSFTNNIECFDEICNKIYEILENPNFYEDKYYESKKLNEMMLLNIVYLENNHLFNILPSIPSKSPDKNIIFDSITYGQYLSGSHNAKLSKYIVEESSYVGRYLLKKGPKIKFKDKPFLLIGETKYDLANLHIHSKKLEKFLPEKYECLVSF